MAFNQRQSTWSSSSSSSSSSSAPSSAGPVPALTQKPTEIPVKCKKCMGTSTMKPLLKDVVSIKRPNGGDRKHTHTQLREVNSKLEGVIAHLPPNICVPVDSVCWGQASLNEAAFDHPCVILFRSKCQHLVFCAPATSFNGRTVDAKYSGATQNRRAILEYLPLEHSQLGQAPDQLHHSGCEMGLLTYVHLDLGYWIEPECLGDWRINQAVRRLTPQSLDFLLRKYRDEENHLLHNPRRPGFKVLAPATPQRGIPENVQQNGSTRMPQSPPRQQQSSLPPSTPPRSNNQWRRQPSSWSSSSTSAPLVLSPSPSLSSPLTTPEVSPTRQPVHPAHSDASWRRKDSAASVTSNASSQAAQVTKDKRKGKDKGKGKEADVTDWWNKSEESWA